MPTTLAISTGNNPLLLKRSLRSYLSHAVVLRRTDIRFLVVDESEDLATRNENKRIAREASHSLRTRVDYFSGRETESAVKLLKQKGVAEEEAEFAFRSAKNAAVLASAGDITICVDEASCAKAVSSGDDLTVLFRTGTLGDPTGVVPYESRSVSLLDSSFGSGDLFSTLTRFVGRDAGNIRTAEAWRGRHPTHGRVCVMQAGTVGGSTFGWSAYPLLRLVSSSSPRSETAYSQIKTGKAFLRGVRRVEIGTWSFVVPRVLALDTTAPLPPFIPGSSPSLGGGSALFGLLLRFYCPWALVGFVPSAVYFNPQDPGSFALDLPSPVFQDVVADELESASSYSALGERLQAASRLSSSELSQRMVGGATRRREALRGSFQRALTYARGLPAWRDDLETLLVKTTSDSSYLPSDLTGTEAEVVDGSKDLLDRCGRLVARWPTLLGQARELRSSGKELAITL